MMICGYRSSNRSTQKTTVLRPLMSARWTETQTQRLMNVSVKRVVHVHPLLFPRAFVHVILPAAQSQTQRPAGTSDLGSCGPDPG